MDENTPLVPADTPPAPPVPLQDAFKLPSTTLFLGLIPVFSGVARRADLAAVLSAAPQSLPPPQGTQHVRPAHVRTYIVRSGRESRAQTSLSLFDDDPLWNEGELSLLIKRQFGPVGLKHLLGVLIAADEQAGQPGMPPGAFVFDASQHLDLLGYTRCNRVNGKGYHTARHLREAREIVALLCALTIVQETRLGPRRGATVKVRLLLDEASAEAWEETVADGARLKERITTNEKIFLRFNPHLFMAAARGSSRTRCMYTLQLRKLARENAQLHSLTLTLGVHLPIKFRLNNCRPLCYSARAFLRMAGIAEDEYTRYEQLERLENALRHMVEQGYLKAFETGRFRYVGLPQPLFGADEKRGKKRPRRPRVLFELKGEAETPPPEPLEEMWQVEPPEFFKDLLETAEQSASYTRHDWQELAAAGRPQRARSSQPLLPGLQLGDHPPDASEMLKLVRQALNLSQAKLAQRLNVTQAAVSMAEMGKRPRMARRLLEAARRLRAPSTNG
ncbi:MAG: helix-turn-helix transcriptional regulator [Planctomycetota bacterium]